jgi:CheY-like chemotaxis protein
LISDDPVHFRASHRQRTDTGTLQWSTTMNHITARPTVLLVDDCVAERDLYELVLAPECTVLTASRGSDALALAAQTHPDVIVMDVMMPELDGWETCARLKTNPVTADTPVLLLTGANDVDLSQHAVAVGADAIMNKPCPADALLHHIHIAADHQQRR